MRWIGRVLLRRPSPAMAVAVLALVIALGTSVAQALPAFSVGPAQLRTGAVITSKLAPGSVTYSKLAPQVSGAKVRDNSLLGADINEATLANNYVAFVEINGGLGFASRGVSVVSHNDTRTIVQFPGNTIARPIFVSLGGRQNGELSAGTCGTGPGQARCGAGHGRNRIGVETYDSAGRPARRAFFILLPRGPN